MAKKKLLIAAIIVGAFAALLVFLYSQRQEEQLNAMIADQVEVVYAASDIPEGAPLTKDNVTTKKIPRSNLPPNPVLKEDLNDFLEARVAHRIEANSMILTSNFATVSTSSSLASRIPPGERAMAVPVDSISGVSGLLNPGDRVDVLGTFPVGSKEQLVEDGTGGASVGYMTITLLQNVTLLAVGQEISGIGSAAQAGGGEARGGYSAVTVSVTIGEAELLTIAQTRGELMLLLRHSEDVEIGSIKRTTLRTVLEDLEVINKDRVVRTVKARPKAPAKPSIEVIRGSGR